MSIPELNIRLDETRKKTCCALVFGALTAIVVVLGWIGWSLQKAGDAERELVDQMRASSDRDPHVDPGREPKSRTQTSERSEQGQWKRHSSR